MVQKNDLNLNNELNNNKFKLVFPEVKAVELLCTAAQLPSMDANAIDIPNPHNMIWVPGKKVTYSPLSVTFKVDENLTNYKEIMNWMTSIYAPQKYEQFKEFQERSKMPFKKNVYGFDASLITLTNADNFNLEAVFINLFPTSLTSIDLEHSSEEIVFASATFQFDYYYLK